MRLFSLQVKSTRKIVRGIEMPNVIVYHGTTIDRAREIIKNRVLHTTDNENCRYESTGKGYVYVTKRLCDALDFSTRGELGKDTLTFAVFKIQIDERELMPDLDEVIFESTLSRGGEDDCFIIHRDLNVGTDVVAVFAKKMVNYEQLGSYMQQVEDGRRIIKESEWKKLCPN